MSDETRAFGDMAQKLARNPLAIIALFIVLVYGFAALVTTFSGALATEERLPLIYFLVLFPVLVLGVFAWLVSRHSNKLFAPSDFRNEENYVRMLSASASLAVASVKDGAANKPDIDALVAAIQAVAEPGSPRPKRRHSRTVLWVDDHPANNFYERQAFEAMGLGFTLAESTAEALREMESQDFAAIISDMGRREGPREGYILLDTIRGRGDDTPFFVYASSDASEHRRETFEHKGQGCTNDPQELFQMVMRAVLAG
jgi:CheY-like chemotaxis protein